MVIGELQAKNVCLNCKISIVFSLAVSMVGTASLRVSVIIGVLTYIIMKGKMMSNLTMIYSIIGGVLVLMGLLVQMAPTMIRYGKWKLLELDLG